MESIAAVHVGEIPQRALVTGVSIDELLARLLQYALLEIGPLAEEFLIRRCGGVLGVLDCRKLHGADAVRRLRQAVLGRLRRSVDDGVLRQRVLDSAVKRFRDRVLTVVVVDLDRVVSLQLREVIEQEVHDAPTHRPRKLVERGEMPGRVYEGMVLHGHVTEEDAERAEQHLTRPQIEARVLILAIREQQRIEGCRDPLGLESALTQFDRVRYTPD